jgi:hypothetical protein
MGKYVAKLTGESDGYSVSRDFADAATAIAWLQRDGLAKFDDQTARGEVFEDGKIVWTKSHLQTPEQAERERLRDGQRLLASIGIVTPKGTI